jgi:uncharacterized membrane protein
MGAPAEGWSAIEALTFGWEAIKSDYVGVAVPIVVASFAVGVVSGGVSFIMSLFRAALVRLLVEGGVGEALVLSVASIGINLVTQLFSMLLQALIMGGIVDLCLRVCRGGKAPLSTVLSGARYFVPMFIGQLLMMLAIFVGSLLCVVPGVILALGLLFWSYLVVDRGLGPVAALQRSWEITNGHKMNVFLFLVLACLVLLAGFVACCVGVLLVSAPVLSVATAYVYLRLNGESPRLATA